MFNVAQRFNFLQARARLRLGFGNLRSIGGTTWTVQRRIGDGRTTRATLTSIGTVEGYVSSRTILQNTPIGSEVVGIDTWWYIATPDQTIITPSGDPVTPPTIAEGDIIISTADSSYSFQLGPVEVEHNFVQSELKEQ